jgi:hypothetical protein
MVVVYVDSIRMGTPETAAILRPLIEQHFTPKMTHLITTRFDNDDALSENFVSTIQQEFNFQEFEFINLPDGYLWHKNKLYTKRDLSNPFISLIESVSDFQTVWCSGHHLLDSLGPIRQVETNPQWIQVIHKRNVSNRVRVGNIRLPIKSLPTTFHLIRPANLENETEAAIAFENQMKKKIRRFRWKWKQYRRRILGMKQRE